jgi:L-cystine uptake protein TcyP (sodium:dicarboxylate symporter family)
LTEKENTGFLLKLMDRCITNPKGCIFEFKTTILWENIANGGWLDFLKVASLPIVSLAMTGIIAAAIGIACSADPLSCLGAFSLAPAVGLGALCTYYGVVMTRIFFYKEFTSSEIRFK